jgi:RNA polymerase sigma-70 factor (ECF subfamily)
VPGATSIVIYIERINREKVGFLAARLRLALRGHSGTLAQASADERFTALGAYGWVGAVVRANPDSTVGTVVRAQRGDAAAFEQLVREFDEGLRAFSHRVLGPGWTEDVLQESYLRAFRSLPQYRAERGAFRSWLYRIVYRCCLDEQRRSRRRPLVWASGLEELPSSQTSESAVAARDGLWDALGVLSTEERACVILVDGLWFDYESAGTILEVPRGTIASRLNRARPLLRRALREPLEETEGEGHERIPR